MAITEKYVTTAGAGAHDGTDEANAYTFTEMVTAINGGAHAGNRYNIKQDSGHAQTTTTHTFTGDGSTTSPCILRGYKTTITDGYQGRTGSNGALVTTNFPSITFTTGRLTGNGDLFLFECLNISGAPSAALLTLGTSAAVRSCVVTNSSTNAAAVCITGANTAVIYDCDLTLSGASGGLAAINVAGFSTRVIANRIKGGPAAGVTIGAFGSAAVIDNVFFDSATNHVVTTNTGAGTIIYGNTFPGATGNQIDIITGSTILHLIINNMITDGSAFGVDLNNAAAAAFIANNRTRDNSSGAYELGTDWVAATSYNNVTTDTGGAETDYTDAGSDDYTLVSSSPAKGVGQFNYRDIGALQRQESASSSGGVVIGS